MLSDISVLHVDDEPSISDLTATFLERENNQFSVQTATSANEGLDIIGDRPPDCVVSDYNMPGMDGLEFLQAVREEYPDLPFILFTGKGSETVASDAIATGVNDYLQKGSGTEQYELLANRIRNAVRARREAKRADRQEQLMRLTEFAGDTGGFELDRESNTILLTDGTRRIISRPDTFEITLEEALELFHPDDRKDIQQTLDRAFETGEELRDRWRLQTGDGDERLLDITITPVVENGEVTKLRGSGNDITDRMERQRKLTQIETLFQHTQDALFLIDAGEEFTVERVNPAWENALGMSAEQVQDKTPRDVLGEQSGAVSEAKFRECVQRQEPLQYEETARISGKLTYWKTRIAPVVVDGTVEYIAGSTRDITKRKERQQELRRNKRAMDEAPVGIVLSDPSQDDNPLTYVNDRFQEMTGYDEDESTGRNCRWLQADDTREEPVAQMRKAIDAQDSVTVELRNYRKDGTEFWNRVSIAPVYDDQESVINFVGFQQDITDRKQMERNLEQDRNLVTGIVETVPVGISVHDADGSISFMNERMESISGRSLEDLEGNPHDDSQYDLVDKHGQPLGSDETPFDNVLSREAPVHDQIVGFRRPSGERVWVSVSGVPQYNDDDELERTVFAFEDITKQRELEAELSEIFGRISDGFFALDGEFQFTHINSRAEELLEASEDELLGGTPWNIYQDIGEHDELWDSLRAAVDTQDSQSLEINSPGNKWYDVTVYPSESGVSVYFRDVTERKNREQELQELKSQYETLAENFPNGAVFLFDSDLRYVRAGGAELEATGIPPDEIEGATAYDIFPEHLADELTQYYTDTLEGNSHTFIQTIGDKTYRTWTVPVQIGDEDIDYGMGMSQNITDHIEQREELERQNERLEEFAGIVSHDLRNPLQVADGWLELIREECNSDHIDDVAQALDRMDALVEDLLTLAREGEQVGETKLVGLANVATNSWQTVNTEQAVLEPETSQAVEADRNRLQQLFENLYRNAVEHGGDDVTVSVGAIDDGFYVADTGPGIPESDREDVFEAGYSTNEDGTGFGLRIVKQIADAHGWEVAITESEEGGARFEITDVEKGE